MENAEQEYGQIHWWREMGYGWILNTLVGGDMGMYIKYTGECRNRILVLLWVLTEQTSGIKYTGGWKNGILNTLVDMAYGYEHNIHWQMEKWDTTGP